MALIKLSIKVKNLHTNLENIFTKGHTIKHFNTITKFISKHKILI